MPLGSSSATPVISPGPRRASGCSLIRSQRCRPEIFTRDAQGSASPQSPCRRLLLRDAVNISAAQQHLAGSDTNHLPLRILGSQYRQGRGVGGLVQLRYQDKAIADIIVNVGSGQPHTLLSHTLG